MNRLFAYVAMTTGVAVVVCCPRLDTSEDQDGDPYLPADGQWVNLLDAEGSRFALLCKIAAEHRIPLHAEPYPIVNLCTSSEKTSYSADTQGS